MLDIRPKEREGVCGRGEGSRNAERNRKGVLNPDRQGVSGFPSGETMPPLLRKLGGRGKDSGRPESGGPKGKGEQKESS